jgi:hypothetical protein
VDFVSRLTMLDDSDAPTSLPHRDDATMISTPIPKDDLSLIQRLHGDVSAMSFNQAFWPFLVLNDTNLQALTNNGTDLNIGDNVVDASNDDEIGSDKSPGIKRLKKRNSQSPVRFC